MKQFVLPCQLYHALQQTVKQKEGSHTLLVSDISDTQR